MEALSTFLPLARDQGFLSAAEINRRAKRKRSAKDAFHSTALLLSEQLPQNNNGAIMSVELKVNKKPEFLIIHFITLADNL